MENLYYYDLGREVPEAAKKKITGGRMNGKTDINPMWRIKKLTELFGPCGVGWYYNSVREWIEPYEKSVAAFVKIELYVKVDGAWSMPIQGTGGSMFVEMQKAGPYVSDECYKMATTDAISVACKQLGIGADVYWDKDPTKYSPTGENRKIDAPVRQEGKKKAAAPVRQGGNGKAEDSVENAQNASGISEYRRSLLFDLSAELTRTGYDWKAVTNTYKVEDLNDVTDLQLKDCIKRTKKLPDKVES